jgi:glycerol-1-phosphate dehydrogenase [NAD(P)+]
MNPIARLSLSEALASARETRDLTLGRGVVNETAAVFARHFPGRTAVIVTDGKNHERAAVAVGTSLDAGGVPRRPDFIYPQASLYAESPHVATLEESLRTHDAIPVAVGSGTINDLVKLAAHRAGRESYLCVATAASMDGYTAFGASITHDGAKQTFSCPAPRAVVADLDIIAGAPPEMTAAGYADLLAKVTAGADWILADALGEDPIDPRAWAIVQGGLRDALADPEGARLGRVASVGPLTEGLMLGGFAMQWSRSSRPASGAEHQFSHLWDMEHHVHRGEAPSHGFKVGVATHAVTRLYEELLAEDFGALDIAAAEQAWAASPVNKEAAIRARFHGCDFVETAVAETRAKAIDAPRLRAQLQRLRENWPVLRERLRTQLLPAEEVRSRLAAVGAPTEPEQIGLSRARLRDTFIRAFHIRRRFTVLDVAMRTNRLEGWLDRIFGPAAVWNTDEDRKDRTERGAQV